MPHARSHAGQLVVVFVALLLFPGLTVDAARHDWGHWNFVVALLIASAKALLITLYFMQLRSSHPLPRLVFAAGLLWSALLFTLSLADYWTRHWLVVAAATPVQRTTAPTAD